MSGSPQVSQPGMEGRELPPGPGPGQSEYHRLPLYPPAAAAAAASPYSFVGVAPPVPATGGAYPPPDHSSSFTQTFLRGILTSIDSRDPVVANAWLETLLDAIDLLPIDVVRQEIIGIAIGKSQLSQPPFSRVASCKMLGKLSTKLEQQSVRQEVLPATLSLCQDVEPDVRDCMCRHLAFVARGVGLDLTKSAILPVLVELSNDESADVRLSAIETVVHLLSLLDDEVCNSTIVPLVVKSCEQAKLLEDCTLPAIARHLGRLCHGLTPNLSQEQKDWFVVYYQQLSRLGTPAAGSAAAGGGLANPPASKPMPDLVPRTTADDKTEKYRECRQACAYNLPGMILFVGAASFADKLHSTFCDFAADPSPAVRRTLAAALHELIKILGANFGQAKSQLVVLFNDPSPDVLGPMVGNMVSIIDALARFGVLQFGCSNSYSQELSAAILHCEEVINSTRNWRQHADCLEKLSCLANCLSAASIQQQYIPLLFHRAHTSRPLPCRVAAVRTLLVILRFTIKEADRAGVLGRVRDELARGYSCHSRMLFLKMCEMAVMLFSRAYFKLHFFNHLLALSQDTVPNIRLKVVSLLPQLKRLLALPSDRLLLQQLEKVVKELMLVESDRDVLLALQNSIERLADVETLLDVNLASGVLSEEDRDDERKQREERLISNMEEQIKQVQGAKFEQLVVPPPSAIPSRLKSLGLDRKRSESLPPSATRGGGEFAAVSAKPRCDSPDAAGGSSVQDDLAGGGHPPPPPYAPELQTIWSSDMPPRQASYDRGSKMSSPYSSSLENLDPSTQEFLVDAGIKLPTSSSQMTSAASLPNLSTIGKLKEPINRSNSTPDHSVVDADISKFLISNEEMEAYEAEYHAAAQEAQMDQLFKTSEEPSLVSPQSNFDSKQLRRGRSETKLRPPSFTSALTGKAAPVTVSGVPVSKPLPMYTTKPSALNKVENGEQLASSKMRPVSQMSGKTGGKDEMSRSQKWNDGSIERLAEKWAAKRDTLLKETGILAENLQQRKAAMEEKLESVKRSIPKRSFSSKTIIPSPNQLSFLETAAKVSEQGLTIEGDSPRPNGLDANEATLSELAEPLKVAKELVEKQNNDHLALPNVRPQRKSSPDLGSSDSDDSLPPYPVIEAERAGTDKPLPPPPSLTDVSPAANLSKQPKVSSPARISTTSLLTYKGVPVAQTSPTYKTVTAPQTSVAVSRSIPAPQKRIANSPKLPIHRYAGESKLSPKKTFGTPVKKTVIHISSLPKEDLGSPKVQPVVLADQGSSRVGETCSFPLESSNFEGSDFANKTMSETGLSTPQKKFGLPNNAPTSLKQLSSLENQPVIRPGTRPTEEKLAGQPEHQQVSGHVYLASKQLKPVERQQAGQAKPYQETQAAAGRSGLRPPQSQAARYSYSSTEEPVVARHAADKRGRHNKSLSADNILGSSKTRTAYRLQPAQPAGSLGAAEARKSADMLVNYSRAAKMDDSPATAATRDIADGGGAQQQGGLYVPRRSSGVRMWQNGRRQLGRQARSMSRSPSPSAHEFSGAEEGGGGGGQQQQAGGGGQRQMLYDRRHREQRSNSSGSGFAAASFGYKAKISSAPSTPRRGGGEQAAARPSSIHSSPGGSRSSSPVAARQMNRRSSHYPTGSAATAAAGYVSRPPRQQEPFRSVSERSLVGAGGREPPAATGELAATRRTYSQTSILPRPRARPAGNVSRIRIPAAKKTVH